MGEQPFSHRAGGVGPRVTIDSPSMMRKYVEKQTVTLDEADFARLRELWAMDLAILRRELRPWYVRLMDWWHGR